MATNQGEATAACGVHAAGGKQIGAIWRSHGWWRRVGTQQAKKHGQRRGEVETLRRVWGWRVCERCDETLVLGEVMLRVPAGDGMKEVCLGCAGTWSTEGPTLFGTIAGMQRTARPSLEQPGPETHGCDAHAA
jgi:hypothetical protein